MTVPLQHGDTQIMADNELQPTLDIQKYIQMGPPLLPLNPMDLLPLGEIQVMVDLELQQILDIQKYIQMDLLLLP